MAGRLVELGAGLALACAATAWTASRSPIDADGVSGAAGASPVVLERAPRAVVPIDEPDVPLGKLGAEHDDDRSLPTQAPAVHATEIRARLDAGTHTVTGEERVTWTNPSTTPATELWLHLYLNAFKNERTLLLRARVGEGRGAQVPSDWGYVDVKSMRVTAADGPAAASIGADLWPGADKTSPGDPEDQTDIRVPLPHPVAPGQSITLEIAFDSKLPAIIERTGYFGSFHMVAQWFPKIARRTPAGAWNHFAFHRLSEFSADFGRYDVTLDTPDGFVVGATGRRVSEARANGRVVSRWQQANVHDFAWTAWDGFEERQAEIEGVDVRVLAPPGHERAAKAELAAVEGGLRCFGRRYGRYPYDTLTVVHPPPGADEAGGMEYPTLITTGGPWHGEPAPWGADVVTIHELGHQWFYGMVATDEHSAPFLDEGINSYAEAACLRERFGDGSAIDAPAFARVSMETVQREGALHYGRDATVAMAAEGFPTAWQYSALVYWRTATLLRTIDGALGGGVVDRALGRYARAYRFRHPDARHLLDAFEQAGGAQARDALRVGLFERGWVDFAVVDMGTAKHASALGVFDRDGGRETVTSATATGDHDGWAVIARRGTIELPVDVALSFRDGSRRTVRWDGRGDWARIEWSHAPELERVTVDPDRRIALDEHHANDARAVAPSRFGWRTAERAAYLSALATWIVQP
jgi:hypothetical protein